ncbi:hypothetical protein ABPG74_009911 [Tetrahymena malaccensis]
MNSKIVFALFSLLAISIAAQGATTINCNKSGVCNDANCGKSGKVENWQVSGTQCVIADCSQLTITGATISTNACTSCNSNSKPANTQANSSNTACIAKSNAKLLVASATIAILALLF